MCFLKRLFGSDSNASSSSSNADGFFVYVQCDNCRARVRLRINKQHDLNHEGGGFVWHKTIVDSRCFRQMPTVIYFDRHYNILSEQIEGGHLIDQSEFESLENNDRTGEDKQSV